MKDSASEVQLPGVEPNELWSGPGGWMRSGAQQLCGMHTGWCLQGWLRSAPVVRAYGGEALQLLAPKW